jgi:hypothetical protein
MDEFEQWIKERQRQTAGIHAGRTYAAVLRMYRSLGKHKCNVPLGSGCEIRAFQAGYDKCSKEHEEGSIKYFKSKRR